MAQAESAWPREAGRKLLICNNSPREAGRKLLICNNRPREEGRRLLG
jgi:hypothetical protein